MIADSMRQRTLLSATLLLAILGACRDPDAPRPVSVLPTPSPGGSPASPEAGEVRPLSTRDDAATDVRPVAPTPTPAPASAAPLGSPDPAEAGIPDLARLARYVFREMRSGQSVCSFSNPLHDPVSFALHIEARGGRMTEVHLAWAGVRVGEELQRLQPPPPELTAYVQCLTPRLQAVVMDPAPADGTYRPEYSYPGHRAF